MQYLITKYLTNAQIISKSQINVNEPPPGVENVNVLIRDFSHSFKDYFPTTYSKNYFNFSKDLYLALKIALHLRNTQIKITIIIAIIRPVSYYMSIFALIWNLFHINLFSVASYVSIYVHLYSRLYSTAENVYINIQKFLRQI